MRVERARIGNSRGIRTPKPLIAECGLGDVVELRVTREGPVFAPYRAPREGWREALASAAKTQNSLGLDNIPANTFDREEGEW